jgi:hypothetical protein
MDVNMGRRAFNVMTPRNILNKPTFHEVENTNANETQDTTVSHFSDLRSLQIPPHL